MHDISYFAGKTVVVTGADGFIGRHLWNRLSQVGGIKLVRLSRRSQAYDAQNYSLLCVGLNGLKLGNWKNAGIDKVDILFHLAAFIPKNKSECNELTPICRDNLLGTQSLVSSLPSIPEMIVFASTVDVYATDFLPLNENSPIKPMTLYASSKLFCEELIRTFSVQSNCPYKILRYGHIYGPGEEKFQKFIPITIVRLLKATPPLVFGDGLVLRDYLHVQDAVEATIRSALCNDAQPSIINVVSGESHSILETARILMQYTDFDGDIEFVGSDSPPCSIVFENSAMQTALGSWMKVDFTEGLKEEISYFRSLLVPN
jgi:nucleoside-diphosphate-sugar epimerase